MSDHEKPPASRPAPDVVSIGETKAYTSELRQDGALWLLTADDKNSEVPPPPPGLVPAVQNAIAIVNHFNRIPDHRASLTEIVGALTISKSHCHAILKTLAHYGWLKFDDRSKTYELSSGLLSSVTSLLGSPALDTIRRELQHMAQRIRFPAVLIQPQVDHSFIVIDKFNIAQGMEVSFPIGHHYPRDATANMRAYLAWQSDEAIEAWLKTWKPVRYTSHTIVTPEEQMAEIMATRQRGYSRSTSEFTEGLMALGAPIFGRHGEVMYVFSCSGLMSEIAPRETELSREVVRTANIINRALFARVPTTFPNI